MKAYLFEYFLPYDNSTAKYILAYGNSIEEAARKFKIHIGRANDDELQYKLVTVL